MIPYQIIDLLVSIVRFLGLVLFGVGLGWLVLDLLKKDVWQLQIAVFLGLLGLAIALAIYVSGGFAGFVIGFGVAIFMWGMPKKKKEEKTE